MKNMEIRMEEKIHGYSVKNSIGKWSNSTTDYYGLRFSIKLMIFCV